MRSYGITNCAPYAAAPPVGAAGDTYWNTTSKTLYVSDGTVWVAWPSGSSSANDAVKMTVIQNAHGFAKLVCLRLSGTTWVRALADTAANADVVGVVSNVIDANTFEVTLAGKISGGNVGQTGPRWLSDVAIAGQSGILMSAAPTTPGHVDKPILYADDPDSIVQIQRGFVIPALPTGALGNLAEAYDEGVDVSTTTNADIPTLQVSFTAVSGRSYMVSWGALIQSAANDRVMLRVMNITTGNLQICSAQRFAQATPQTIERVQLLRCPSNQIPVGVNTIKLNAWRLSGTGTTRVTSGTVDPGFLVVADAGKTPA